MIRRIPATQNPDVDETEADTDGTESPSPTSRRSSLYSQLRKDFPTLSDDEVRACINAAKSGGPVAPAVTPPRQDVKFHSVETVAAMLGLVPAEVRALIRDGDLPARQVGAHWFVTADRLGAFMCQTTDRARCPRFKAGEPVVFLTDKLQVLPGVYVGDTADGRVIVERRGFFGAYREAFNARQVQPLTARLPAAQVQ